MLPSMTEPFVIQWYLPCELWKYESSW